MPGTLAELYGALLKQEPQGILSAARFNPLMMAKALRQQEANPRPALASLMNYPQTWQQFGDNIQANYPTDSPAAVRQAAFEAAKNAGPLMTVWQGSPHRFAPTERNPLGEFDASKIGTGEGAQAYGYGHYLAEEKAVASGYKQAGSRPSQAQLQRLRDAAPVGSSEWKHYDNLMSQDTSGHLYKVDLPDDQIAKMLDWDAPLNKQSAGKAAMDAMPEIAKPNMTGQQFHDALIEKIFGTGKRATQDSNGARVAAMYLRDSLGIPGIKYLDQGSRSAGVGTSNFVVFPGGEGLLKILARE